MGPPPQTAAALAAGLTQQEVDQALLYAAAFYGNLGNYKSFGDSKFIPSLAPAKFRKFFLASKADAAKVNKLWQEACLRMYSLLPRERQLGLGRANGVTTYFSENCEQADAEIAGRFLDASGISP